MENFGRHGEVVQIDGLLSFGRCEMVWSEGTQPEESVGTGHAVLGRAGLDGADFLTWPS